ncbi:MRPL37 [Candida margitis]|uniref:MRPL37 n=1 Tax=Candida margitis TaxID=1775924 RepID=UPI002226F89B|nr:MRPL37 [Candida margitis]KAI5953097.1 MRPL37 [Candida margitis]
MFTTHIRHIRSSNILKRSLNTSKVWQNASEVKTAPVVSSCKAGTPLNLKIFKKGDEPVAKEDSEYPEWLWTMIDPKVNLENIKNENFLRWRRIKLQKENNNIIRNNNFLSKI